jgi:hypothetical protein
MGAERDRVDGVFTPMDDKGLMDLFSRKQSVPFTMQGPLKTEKRCNENVDIACLNFLNRSDIKIGQFRQFFLSHANVCSFPSHVGSELFQLK